MTERADRRRADDGVEAGHPDPGADRDPAEGGRDAVADQPGADTAAGDEPAKEDDQDH